MNEDERRAIDLLESKKYQVIYDSDRSYGRTMHGQNSFELFKDAESVIDVGCGYNGFCAKLKELGVPRAVGVDFVCGSADIICSIYNLPAEDKSFEWCTAFDVLEHLPEALLDDAYEEMMRVSHKFCLSLGTFRAYRYVQGRRVELHLTVKPFSWWLTYTKRFSSDAREYGRAHSNKHPYIVGTWND